MKWIMIIAFCFHARGHDLNCGRAKRTFGLLADENDRDALHVHLWNDMNQEENVFPNIFGDQATTARPPDIVTMPAIRPLTELPQEMYRKSDRELYGKFYKLPAAENGMLSGMNFYPTMANYVPNGYKTNVRVQSVSQLPAFVRQSLYGMFKNPNQPSYYTNVPRKKRPRLPTPVESDLIRFATGQIVANEPKPQKYHTFQLHEAMPAQKLLPPTRVPLFKPVPPSIKMVPVIDDDYGFPHRNRHQYRPHMTMHQPQALFHPTTFQLNNTHPYPFYTEFNGNNGFRFNLHDAMTTSATTSTTTVAPITTTDVATPATTTSTSPATTTAFDPHVTYNRPTYPNVVYAVPATTERTNSTQPTVTRSSNHRSKPHEYRGTSKYGNVKGNINATTRPTFGRRRPLRKKLKRRPLNSTKIVAQINKPLPIASITTTTMPQHAPKWNHRNETFRIVVNENDSPTTLLPSIRPTTSTPRSPTQDGVVYGRPVEAIIVDPPTTKNSTIEVNTPYSKQISNRNDRLPQDTASSYADDLTNLNRDIKRVLDVTLKPTTQATTDDDDVYSDPMLMENLNKHEMMPIAAANIFDRDDLFGTKKRAFADAQAYTAANRRSDTVDNVTTVDVDSNAIIAETPRALDDDKYYKWYSRYAADNKRKYGRAIISEHFKKVEIEPNVAWVILPRKLPNKNSNGNGNSENVKADRLRRNLVHKKSSTVASGNIVASAFSKMPKVDNASMTIGTGITVQ